MKKITRLFYLLGFFFMPMLVSVTALASNVQMTVQLQNYGGDGAYLAFYLTDEKGAYTDTLWIAGTKPKYYKHLPGWARGSGRRASEYDGLTGASVSAGDTFTVTVHIDDAFINAGFQIRVDASVEDMRDISNEVVVPLTTSGAGLNHTGRHYVRNFKYSL
ncbi:DUF2271 domain-containing protein [Aliidiomarina quisquiliarum]|uniref:DUF2271 domain-containing protein n=1 Tax=Aliidiomarina quisquiliarum TaxID=2938947 RepID=UPI00208F2F78|nr:DUF2271 domain-containing protein [Aliidiomarina quisquiliarum]MCO4321789.1 DUF2271 domain-containing protein [Aliidiomarina quisquiliarum]